MSERNTKERILDAAEELMLTNSFCSVGLKQILDTVKVPKGSFYHYFESKEQFGVELLRHYMEAASIWKRSYLFDQERTPDPQVRLFTYLEGSIEFMNQNPGKFPCLAVKLASEVSDLSEDMREELVKGFQDWIDIYQAVLDEMVDNGQLPKKTDTATEAALIQDHWAGAAQRAVTFRSSEPVALTVEHIKTRIKAMNP